MILRKSTARCPVKTRYSCSSPTVSPGGQALGATGVRRVSNLPLQWCLARPVGHLELLTLFDRRELAAVGLPRSSEGAPIVFSVGSPRCAPRPPRVRA